MRTSQSMTVQDALSALRDATWWAVHVWLAPAQVVARATAVCTNGDHVAGHEHLDDPDVR